LILGVHTARLHHQRNEEPDAERVSESVDPPGHGCSSELITMPDGTRFFLLPVASSMKRLRMVLSERDVALNRC
jgi:hypothetical protein